MLRAIKVEQILLGRITEVSEIFYFAVLLRVNTVLCKLCTANFYQIFLYTL